MALSVSDERRHEIARLAVSRFAVQGFDGTSMSDLARHVGLSKAGIYHYFPTKEAILAEALLEYSERLLSTVLQAAAGDGEPVERLGRVIGAILALYRDADAYHQVQINDLARLAPADQEIIRANERQVVRVMEGVLARLERDIDEVTLKALTMSVFGILNWKARWFRDGPGRLDLGDYITLVTEFVAGGVVRVARTSLETPR
ncbi:MAG: TetR/AcrR family transcriptional regulator [Ferrimicrobium sp.]|uniref:TetR/AcrR family transcriptional regulator n=1 Tax=Ferrimicrobium acidiphilum TaxID=121039 RepID=A0ABV3Y0D4_9ACTN|nr:TetR/AcrR family transcriptional regulator [Ferrimicrobium sp.]